MHFLVVVFLFKKRYMGWRKKRKKGRKKNSSYRETKPLVLSHRKNKTNKNNIFNEFEILHTSHTNVRYKYVTYPPPTRHSKINTKREVHRDPGNERGEEWGRGD